MHEIIFYKDKNGNIPVRDYIEELEGKKDKDSRIKYNKIVEYLLILRDYGTHVSERYVKHIEGEIWELRPNKDRILFAALVNDSFVLLHSFVKKTQKTPRGEIEKAKRELKEFKEQNNYGL